MIASETAMADLVRLTSGGGVIAPDEDGRFSLPEGTREVRYRMNLAAVAQEHADIDVAYEASDGELKAWVAAGSTWILRPHPTPPDMPVTVRVDTAPGMGFVTGLSPRGDGYELLAREIRFATYGVFGSFDVEHLELPGPLALEKNSGDAAHVRLVTLPGELATSNETRLRWVEDTAKAIADFWRGFPVERALLLLIPVSDHFGVAHGKVVAAGGATVAIQIGDRAQRADLYADWILVHELFHLGFPSFSGEGKWLDEGLATYFEPIIRARAGWHSPHAVWSEFARDMSQGLPAVEATGVEKTKSFKGIYWGGAIIALLVDVETRRRTGGKVGLEDGLRAVLAKGGNASRLWKLERAIAVIDERLGGTTLRRLADAHSFGGNPIDLPDLWTKLGVRKRAGSIELDEGASLAAVRQAIIAAP
jgi:hypothetical protein